MRIAYNQYFCPKLHLKVLVKLKSILEQDGFQRYLKNTSWLFAEKSLRIVVSLIVGSFIARYLGPAKYGIYNYAISFVGIFITLSTLGLDSIVVRDLVKCKSQEERNKILGTTFLLKIGGFVLVAFLLLGSLFFAENSSLENTLILIIASSSFFHSFNVIDYHFQSKVLSKYVVFSHILSLLFSAGYKLYLIFTGGTLVDFALVVLFESIVLASGLVYFYLKDKVFFRDWKFDKIMAVQKLKESWPLIFAGVAVSLFLKIDQIMIKEILTDSAAGSYAAAVRLSETWYFIPMMITTSLFPAIVNAKVRNDGSHLIRMQRLFDLMIYLSFAIALPITFLSPFIIELLFGIEYIAAAQILIIQIWTSIFISLGVASGVWLINENKQKLIFLQTTLGAVLNIVLNFIFIPSYGIVAAALTSAFSQLFASLLFDLFFKSTRILFTMKLKAIFFVSLVRKNNS